MGRVLGALIALLALTGCVQVTTPPEPGFSGAQDQAYAEDSADLMWANSPWSELRPDDLEVKVVSEADWAPAVIGCLADAGYTGYVDIGFGGIMLPDSPTEAESLAQMLCFTTWQLSAEDTGRLNEAQLGYLYDYYRESVIPCYELAGLRVGEAPSRADFIADGGSWMPSGIPTDGLTSFEQGASPWYRSTPDNDLLARCPISPPEWDVDISRNG